MKDKRDKSTGDLLASSNAKRQARFAERQRLQGYKQRKFWLTDSEHEHLKSVLLTLRDSEN